MVLGTWTAIIFQELCNIDVHSGLSDFKRGSQICSLGATLHIKIDNFSSARLEVYE
jgi:hypothetical protein